MTNVLTTAESNMIRQNNSFARTFCCTLVLTGVVTFLSAISLAGSEPDDGIQLRILLPKSEICVQDKTLGFEIEVRNQSKGKMTLTPSAIGGRVLLSNRPMSIEDGFRSRTISAHPRGSAGLNENVVLEPGGMHRMALEIELDPEFFVIGVYRLKLELFGRFGVIAGKTAYTDLASNEALFAVQECDR